jgi:hypothetical protein
LHLLEHAASKASESTSEASVKEVIVIVLEEASTKTASEAASKALLLLIHLGLASPKEVIVVKEISEGVSSSEELSEDVFSMTR